MSEDTSVHAENAREKTLTRTVRMPVSLFKMVEAVQAKHGDQYLNDAMVRCISAGVDRVLRKAA